MPISQMSLKGLLNLQKMLPTQVQKIFERAQQIADRPQAPKHLGKSATLMFFEPSTRTRLSFETACHRLGMGAVLFDGNQSTSLEKGESKEDSILNAAAMKPSFLIVRCGDELDLETLASQIDVPILNAGWGVKGHPTQALLDIFTISQKQDLKKLKLLIVGDLKHSRVASSHFELATSLGYQVGICGPLDFLVNQPAVQIFPDLESGLDWATAVLVLRVQFERHDGGVRISRADYRRSFGLGPEKIQHLKADALLLHPGPINHGVELEPVLLSDPRALIFKQVENGVHIRQALMELKMEGGL